MTKEELKQEAKDWIAQYSKEYITNPDYSPFDYAEAIYFASAEPREGRISVLKQENDILRNRLSNIVNSEQRCIRDYEEKLKLLSEYVSNLHILGYSAKKITELVQAKIAGILGGKENG